MKKLTILFCLTLLFISCQKDDDYISNQPDTSVIDDQFAQDNFGQQITANFFGRVVDINGNPIDNVQITLENSITTTDHNGIFILNDAIAYENFAFIKAQKEGYISGSRTLVPNANQNNTIQITLLQKNIIDSVTSGSTSEVLHSSGAKVSFGGEFIDSSGNPYNGQVDVSLHYIEPNQENTFSQMPGMLFGQREDGSASSMETYGMLAVNLFSPAGETLNIAENSPAEIKTPVSNTTPNAPQNIPLWYFDENTGYWKEQGIAEKFGTFYIATVTHFTWWNCDEPFDSVTLCFTLEGNSGNDNFTMSNSFFEIVRISTGQIIYSGYTNEVGQECGLIPTDEEIEIRVYDTFCTDQVVHTQTIGPFSSDSSITIQLPDLTSIVSTTNIIGTALNCNGEPVTNGYCIVQKDDVYEYVSISDGTINFTYTYCLPEDHNIVIIDSNTNQAADSITLTITNAITDLGTINTCGNTLGGIYSGDIILSNQEEIDIFGLYGYTEIDGCLEVKDPNNQFGTAFVSSLAPLVNLEKASCINISSSGLTSLNGLQGLISVDSFLISDSDLINIDAITTITEINEFSIVAPSLTSLAPISNFSTLTILGLRCNINDLSDIENLTNIEHFYMNTCNAVTSLDGIQNFNALNQIGLFYCDGLTNTNELVNSDLLNKISIFSCDALTSVSISSNVTSIDRFNLSTSDLVTSLNGFENVSSINRFEINNCDGLATLPNFSNLTTLGEVTIDGNDALTSLNGLNNLNTITGRLWVRGSAMTSLTDLSNLTSIGSLHLESTNCSSLTGLENISTLTGYLSLNNNPLITSLNPVANISPTTTTSLGIANMDGLTNLQGLEWVTSSNSINMSNNPNLISLDGLENVINCSSVNIGSNQWGSNIGNQNLTDLCALTNLFTNGIYSDVYIDNNAYNPTVQDFIDGNCSQ
ncbi:MAG: hypothetical protein HRT68_08170 [Flavobacteriaceae bacterium]|nr:hypothetical protein [Flavobacteriaceae bacterium]